MMNAILQVFNDFMAAIGAFLIKKESIEIFIVFFISQIFSWLTTNWVKYALPAVPNVTKLSVCRIFAFLTASVVTFVALINMAYALWLVFLAALFSGLFSPTSYKVWKDFILVRFNRRFGGGK